MKKLIYSLLLLVTVFFISCSDQDSGAKNKSSLQLDQFTDKAWLRNSLPSNALAYVRLPTPWFGFAGQSNGFKYAQGNKAHVQEVRKIQQSWYQLFSEELDTQELKLIDVLLNKLIAPVELAALPVDNGSPSPLLVLATKLDYKGQDEFQKALQEIIASFNLPLEMKVDGQGVGRLSMQGMNLVYRYQVATKEFIILSGAMLSPAVLDKGLASLVKNMQHPMQDLESRIDSSGIGLFAWANSQQIFPLASMALNWDQVKQLEAMGIDKMNGLAFGYGVSENKTRLKFLVDMPNVGFKAFIPVASNNFSLESVGTPRSFGLLAFPTSSEMNKVVNAFANIEPKAKDSYLRFNNEAKREIGISADQILDMLGPEVIYFTDDIGSFYATKLNNEAHLNLLIESLKKQGVAKYSVHKKEGINLYHLQIDSMFGDIFNSLPSTPGIVSRFLNSVKTHLYWIQEDGYIVYSSVPQKLLERLNNNNRVSINKWLDNIQSVDVSSSLLAYNNSVKDLSRTSYHYYVEVLTFMADLSGSDFDIMALPTADKLGFADMGTLGLKIDNGEQYLGFEFTFEQSMSDVLATAGGMETVAVIGVLSAIAIPAYQDYIERAKANKMREHLNNRSIIQSSREPVMIDGDSVVSDEEYEVEETIAEEVEIEETEIEPALPIQES